jgi:hypothetical protein
VAAQYLRRYCRAGAPFQSGRSASAAREITAFDARDCEIIHDDAIAVARSRIDLLLLGGKFGRLALIWTPGAATIEQGLANPLRCDHNGRTARSGSRLASFSWAALP